MIEVHIMKIGFARQSTTNQKFGLEHQMELLTKEGCEKIFYEEVSALASKRPEFERVVTTNKSPSRENSIADSNSGRLEASADTSS